MHHRRTHLTLMAALALGTIASTTSSEAGKPTKVKPPKPESMFARERRLKKERKQFGITACKVEEPRTYEPTQFESKNVMKLGLARTANRKYRSTNRGR